VTANRVRIIGGVHRSRVLRFPDRPGLRPTPDRVRETLFNWLGQDLTGRRVLDLYAGSGALGLEAASRGAAEVVLVDLDGITLDGLRANVRLLQLDKVKVVRADALEFLQTVQIPFDVVFADPPYAKANPPELLGVVFPRLAPDGFLYLEAPAPVEESEEWTVRHRLRAGNVHAHLMQKNR